MPQRHFTKGTCPFLPPYLSPELSRPHRAERQEGSRSDHFEKRGRRGARGAAVEDWARVMCGCVLARAPARAAPVTLRSCWSLLNPIHGALALLCLAGSPPVVAEMSAEFPILCQTRTGAWKCCPLKPMAKAPRSCTLWVDALHQHLSPCHRTCGVAKQMAPVKAVPGKHTACLHCHQNPNVRCYGWPKGGMQGCSALSAAGAPVTWIPCILLLDRGGSGAGEI